MSGGVFRHYDTICRQVANRLPNIRRFTECHDWIYFVAGKESSNGKMLYKECCRAHKHVVFVTDVTEIVDRLPPHVKRVGVCGATSTPKWLMEDVASRIRTING
jgi:4-hydroxy-3-methylbut-2-enyl diphosphate reductase